MHGYHESEWRELPLLSSWQTVRGRERPSNTVRDWERSWWRNISKHSVLSGGAEVISNVLMRELSTAVPLAARVHIATLCHSEIQKVFKNSSTCDPLLTFNHRRMYRFLVPFISKVCLLLFQAINYSWKRTVGYAWCVWRMFGERVHPHAGKSIGSLYTLNHFIFTFLGFILNAIWLKSLLCALCFLIIFLPLLEVLFIFYLPKLILDLEWKEKK